MEYEISKRKIQAPNAIVERSITWFSNENLVQLNSYMKHFIWRKWIKFTHLGRRISFSVHIEKNYLCLFRNYATFFSINLNRSKGTRFNFKDVFDSEKRFASLNILLHMRLFSQVWFFWCLQLKKRSLSFMGFPSGIFWLSNCDIILTIMSLCKYNKPGPARSAPYPRLKNSKKNFQVSSTLLQYSKIEIFWKKKFRKNYILKKNGPSGAPGLASANFWRAKVSQCRKTERGDPLRFFNIHSVAKHEKIEEKNFFLFSGKNLTMPKKTERRNPLGFSNIHSVA